MLSAGFVHRTTSAGTVPGSVFLVQSEEKREPDSTPGSIVGRAPKNSCGGMVSLRCSEWIHE